MATTTELERIAAMASALRPDWPTRSVLTLLQADHATRAYRDLAVAMAYIATDPKTQTPKRLSEAGPWWQTTGEATPARVPGRTDPRCDVPGHEHELAGHCSSCRSDELAARAEAEIAAGLLPEPVLSPEQVARNVAGARVAIEAMNAAPRPRDVRELAAGDGLDEEASDE